MRTPPLDFTPKTHVDSDSWEEEVEDVELNGLVYGALVVLITVVLLAALVWL